MLSPIMRPNAPAVQCLSSLVLSYHMTFKILLFLTYYFCFVSLNLGFFINVFLHKKALRVKSCYAVEYSHSKDLVLDLQMISLS